MEFESILWLKSTKIVKIDQRVIKDLNLEGVYKRLLTNDDILYSLIKDSETIQFRQDILEDFMKDDKLLEELMECLKAFYELKSLGNMDKTKAATLYRIIDILMIIEKSVQVVDELKQILDYYHVQSAGLNNLRENVNRIRSTDEYKQMKKDLKEIKYIFRSIRSATLSVNMNAGMRPVFAQITSVDSHVFHYPKAFRSVSDVLKTNPLFLGQLLSSYAPVFKVNRLNYDLMEEIEYALREHKDRLLDFVTTYDHIDVEPFVKLLDEIQFYQSSMELFKQIKVNDLPFSKPFFVKANDFEADIKDFYNINLALVYAEEKKDDPIVLNSVSINPKRRGFIITGANRGGKTTFTQGIGQVQLFAQLGLFVPAKEANLVISNGIITHFPVGEKENYEAGKFGKECERFVSGFRQGDDSTLYLLNESFSGTSHLESLNIATQGCMALLDKGSPFVFNTHLHELYDEVCRESGYIVEGIEEKAAEEKINGEAKVDGVNHNENNVLVSLVTKMDGEHSEYKLIEHKPYGKSYARSIARKYGVTTAQLLGEEVDL